MDSSKVMSRVTAAILLGIVAYVAALTLGKINGDITTVLLILTLVSFAYWLYDKFCLKPNRIKQALAIEAQIRASNVGESAETLEPKIRAAAEPAITPPWWIEWTAGFFWVILIVFVIRSFIIEPYRIPSGSMMPTLEAGDFILVSKSGYGIRLPVVNTQVVEFSKPKRGDVVVFNSPTENLILIKRIIGLPGDEIVYQDKKLVINGESIPIAQVDDYVDTEKRYPLLVPQYQEQMGEKTHHILRRPYSSFNDITMNTQGFVRNRPYLENCTYQKADFTCKVPQGHYFMMGDNRDESLDSRYWGFVPEDNLIGRAFFIWLNVGKLNRIGSFH